MIVCIKVWKKIIYLHLALKKGPVCRLYPIISFGLTSPPPHPPPHVHKKLRSGIIVGEVARKIRLLLLLLLLPKLGPLQTWRLLGAKQILLCQQEWRVSVEYYCILGEGGAGRGIFAQSPAGDVVVVVAVVMTRPQARSLSWRDKFIAPVFSSKS